MTKPKMGSKRRMSAEERIEKGAGELIEHLGNFEIEDALRVRERLIRIFKGFKKSGFAEFPMYKAVVVEAYVKARDEDRKALAASIRENFGIGVDFSDVEIPDDEYDDPADENYYDARAIMDEDGFLKI